ncbi:MAG: MBL fold metallo-hydrolase [Deltaproteobacteria bacterium]|nr:MBL fold metallo-hydrolase [Deltaproteobacteria bacterium]MBI4196930.1 MBL fold metallo-hydrolase [Deltaproteobacteria bacterium]
MKLQFLGATQTVTGSKFLVTQRNKHLLVDCGLFQGLKAFRLKNWIPFPVNPRQLETILLTHAHIDHSGYLPLLVKNGFRGTVYTTAATRALCEILLPDAGHIQEEDALFANKHRFSKHHPALPLYTEEDARRSLEYFKPVPWGKKVSLGRDLSFVFHPAGHILGASLVQLSASGVLVTFSGDLGKPNSLLMSPPKSIPKTDYLVVESTYGNRTHPKENPEETLKTIIHKTIKRGGTLIIPAFAVGRVQEVLLLLARLRKKKAIPNVPIYLNSPMAVEATRTVQLFQKEMSLSVEEAAMIAQTASFVTTVEESKKLNSLLFPSIIISASGMATGGRILHHLKSLAPNHRNTILFAGFQAAGTRGEALVGGAKQIKIHGLLVPVRAEVRILDSLSAHADQEGILSWLRHFTKAPRQTFIVHGEPLAADTLRKRIEEELHWKCHIPDYGESVDLN